MSNINNNESFSMADLRKIPIEVLTEVMIPYLAKVPTTEALLRAYEDGFLQWVIDNHRQPVKVLFHNYTHLNDLGIFMGHDTLGCDVMHSLREKKHNFIDHLLTYYYCAHELPSFVIYEQMSKKCLLYRSYLRLRCHRWVNITTTTTQTEQKEDASM